MPAAPRRRIALVGALVLLAGGGAARVYFQRVEAVRLEQRARDLSFADEDRAWNERRLARLRADRQAALAALPRRVADAFRLPPAAAENRAAELGRRVVGVWVGPHPDGGTRAVEYHPDATFRDAVSGGREWVGTWEVARLTGPRVLHLSRTSGPGVVKVSFEGDELIHDDTPGLATVLRRP